MEKEDYILGAIKPHPHEKDSSPLEVAALNAIQAARMAMTRERLELGSLRAEAYENYSAAPFTVRVSTDTGERATVLARALGTRRATWAAMLITIAAKVRPHKWHTALAAMQKVGGADMSEDA